VRRADAGKLKWFVEDDLYPDVRPCLAALREVGVSSLQLGPVGHTVVCE
jgi:hypothetical protein